MLGNNSKNKKLIWSIITIVFLAVAGGIFFGFSGQQKYKEGEVKISGQVFKVDIADTAMKRAQGLSGREKLEENEGMLFIFDSAGSQGFWMKDMKFALDMVWIKGDKIVGFSKNVQPEPEKSIFRLTIYNSPEPVDRVLEINGGLVDKYGIEIGDRVEFGD